METIASDAAQPVLGSGAAPRPEKPRALRPVLGWAALGAAVLLLDLYVFGSWVVFDHPTATPAGADPVPTYMVVAARIADVVSVPALVAFVWFFLVRPWRRAGHLTLDGMFVIAYLTMYWLDPLPNYTQWWITYNAAMVNWGAWGERVPGWSAPNGHLFPEPIVFFLPTYVYAMFGGAVLANKLMRKARARWPSISNLRLIALTYVGFLAFDLAVEVPCMLLGLWQFPGSIRSMTIFAGHYYQYPVYEAFLLGATWTAFACMRFFLDDRGRTIAERGVDSLGMSVKAKRRVQTLAVIGLVNVAGLVTYILPAQWLATHADAWPKDITSRSYLTDGYCGPGTDYACPGPDVPIPRGSSAHVRPDGSLAPAG